MTLCKNDKPKLGFGHTLIIVLCNVLCTALCITLSQPSWADQPQVPLAKVFAAPTQEYYLKLLPDPSSLIQNNASGAVYAVRSKQDELLYSLAGWYAHSALLSGDGEFIVRLGLWPDFDAPPGKTVALAFYQHGKLIKRYMVADVMDDLSQLKFSVSHYDWGGDLRWADDVRTETQRRQSADGESYEVVYYYPNEVVQIDTVEGKTLKFYIKTGERLQ